MIQNKVVLITGAAHRIGAVTARLLHQAGMNIVLHYRGSRKAAQQLQKELLQLRADSVVLVQADLQTPAALPALVQQAHASWQRLDVLIYNASTFYRTAVGSVSEKQWNELVDTNLKAPFFLAQAAAPYLQQSKGCIVNIVDIHADRPLKDYPIYCMTKAGLVMLTKALAAELGPNIRVNAVAPGAILWPEHLDEVNQQRIVSKTFLKRKGDPEDIAKTILFLINDANSGTE